MVIIFHDKKTKNRVEYCRNPCLNNVEMKRKREENNDYKGKMDEKGQSN